MEESGLGSDFLPSVHQYIFYYLFFDVSLRVFFQEVSEVKFRQLCLLPIKKSSIINHILKSTVISLFNILPLFFLIPFVIRTLIPAHGILAGICWLLSVIALILFNNFLTLQIKHWVANKPLLYIVPAAIAGIVFFIDNQGWIPLSLPFDLALQSVLHYLLPAAAFIALMVGMYRIDFRRMRGQAYITGDFKKKGNILEKLNFSKLGEKGFFGMVSELNLQLIFRNKRIRTQVITSAVFLLAGIPIFLSDQYGPGFRFYFVLAMTGMIGISFAQFIWSYQASYFEMLWTLPFDMKKYINAQYNFLIIACASTSVIALLYYFIDPILFYMVFAGFLFNIGVNVPFLLAASCYNKKKIEVSTSGTFNMQGVGGMQLIFNFVVLLGPLFIFLPFSLFGFEHIGLMVVGGIGILGLLIKPLSVKGIVSLAQEKKYSQTEGYRSN